MNDNNFLRKDGNFYLREFGEGEAREPKLPRCTVIFSYCRCYVLFVLCLWR